MPSTIVAHKAFRVLAASAVAVTHTGDTNETALATITVPANSLGANGVLRITAVFSMTNDASTKTARIRYSSITGTIYNTTPVTTSASVTMLRFIANRNATNSQVGGGSTTQFAATSAVAVTSAVDTTAATTVVLTGELADGTDSITIESYVIEIFYQA